MTSIQNRNPTQSWVNAYDVFNEFIYRNERDELVCERILSSECFLRWMETRRKSIKHPKASFRRCVLAHLRAADRRAPFPEDVEESLLKQLRVKDDNNESVDPFFFCGVARKTPYLKKYAQSWRNKFDSAYGYHEKRKLLINQNANQLVSVRRERQFKVSEEIMKALRLNPDNFSTLYETALEYKLNIFSPAVLYYLSAMQGQNHRLSEEYVLPKPEECQFLPHLPIIQLVTNSKTWMIEWIDEVSRKAIPHWKTHMCTGFTSSLEFLAVVKIAFPLIEERGKLWFRYPAQIQGYGFNVLMYVEPVGNGRHTGYMQVLPQSFDIKESTRTLLL
eukprot:maker-scaffold_2-snap-gene-21.59-mRNA-1 protein AED:0.31 eAED:0.31 QI:112/1/1/1/1/1/4/151/332